MSGLHCHGCGGFIGSDPHGISYQLPSGTVLKAEPRTALCTCEPPVLYEAPPGFMSSPGMPAIRER